MHVVRCIEDENVSTWSVRWTRVRDIETNQTELLLADIETCQKRSDKARKLVKNGEKSAGDELEAAEALLRHMSAVGPPPANLPR